MTETHLKYCKQCGCETEHYKSGHCVICSIAKSKVRQITHKDQIRIQKKRIMKLIKKRLGPPKKSIMTPIKKSLSNMLLIIIKLILNRGN